MIILGAPAHGGGGPAQEYVLQTYNVFIINGMEVPANRAEDPDALIYSGDVVTWADYTTCQVTYYDAPIDGHRIKRVDAAVKPYTVEAVEGASVATFSLNES